MFGVNENMRITKSKSTLKKKLQVEQSTRTVKKPHVVIIDGCAMLWLIQDFVNGFINYILNNLEQCDIYLIFYPYRKVGYYPYRVVPMFHV